MVLKKVFSWLVLSDIYASLIAAGIGLISEAVLGLRISALALIAIFFCALVIYAFNRQDDADIDSIHVPERTKFVAKHGWIILVFSVVGFLATLTYTWKNNSPIFLVMALGCVLGLFYNFPLLKPVKGILGFSRLKEPLMIKNILVSALYSVFVLITILAAHLPISALAIMLMVFVFIRFFIVSTIFDLRDVEGDTKKGINTIPVTYGKENTLAFLNGLNLLTLVLGVVAALGFGIPLIFGAMIFSTFLFSQYYLDKCRVEGADLGHLCSIVVEADFVPSLAIAILFILIHLI